MGLKANDDVKISPQGYQLNDAPTNENPFWTDQGGDTPEGEYIKDIKMSTTSNNVGDTTYTLSKTDQNGITSTVGAFTIPVEPDYSQYVYRVYSDNYPDDDGKGTIWDIFFSNGADASQRVASFLIPDVPNIPDAVNGVAITNENGIYRLTETFTSGKSDTIGVIEIPTVDTSNLLAEVNDAIVENETDGYDYHTITETENGGTRNNVGSFYLARDQVTAIEKASDGNLKISTVNQSGEVNSKEISLPSGGGSGTTPDISATASVDAASGTPSVTVTKSGTAEAPAFDFAFTGLKGAKGDTGETGATGPEGPQGPTGATPDITATASVDATSGTPAVTVTKSGTVEAPSFAFAFTGLKGADGSGGSGGGSSLVKVASGDIDNLSGSAHTAPFIETLSIQIDHDNRSDFFGNAIIYYPVRGAATYSFYSDTFDNVRLDIVVYLNTTYVKSKYVLWAPSSGDYTVTVTPAFVGSIAVSTT